MLQWLECEAAKDFALLLRSRLAEHAAALAENHCANAETFLANGAYSAEYRQRLEQMARYAICLKVLDEVRQDVGRRQSRQELPFDLLSGLQLDQTQLL